MRRSKPEDVAAFAAMTEAPGAVPGAPAALSGRRHGRYATAEVAGVVLHLFDWEVTVEMETFDATAHGEYWRVHVQGDQSWRARARGYFKPSDASYLAARSSSVDPLVTVFTGYSGMETTTDKIVWQGACFITRANFSVPMAMIEQEIELVGTGQPLAGLGVG